MARFRGLGFPAMSYNASGAGASDGIAFAYPEALSEPEKLLAAYFNSSTVGLAIFDRDLRYIAVNRTLAEINGVPAPDHLGKTPRDLLGELAKVVESELRRVIATREGVSLELSATLPTRKEAGYWMVHYLPIQDETGDVTRIGAVVVEITARKKAEETLQQLDERLRKEMERLQMLLDASSILSSNSNLHQIFPQISARIRRVLRHEYAGFELHDPITGLLVRQAEDFPLGKGLLSSLPISPHNSPQGTALQARSPLIFTRNEMDGFEAEISKNFLAEGLQSLCCVPLSRPTGPLGVLVLGSTREDAFHTEDLTLLKQVAAQFAGALENHRTAAEIEALKQRL
ncbi:MAG TPA: PAS domain-containing protein, partial [Candidatus Acidoferrum sp.]|nr:PAS domain-containing protein [Candidatus Acidoferrum sp.]